MKCTYEHRVQLHPSHRIGGARVGHCTRDALPGMVFCHEHANRQAMGLWIRQLSERLAAATAKQKR